MYPLGIIFLTNTQKFISKGLLKIRSNSGLTKVHNYHLVKVSQKQNSHLTSYHFILQPMFSPYKKFGMKFNMNS